MPNVGSQIERAVIAFLKSYFIANALPGLTAVNFYFSNDWASRAAPLIEVLAAIRCIRSKTESPPHTRDENFSVSIEAEWPGTNQPGVANTEMNLDDDQSAFIGTVMAAMSQTESSSVSGS